MFVLLASTLLGCTLQVSIIKWSSHCVLEVALLMIYVVGSLFHFKTWGHWGNTWDGDRIRFVLYNMCCLKLCVRPPLTIRSSSPSVIPFRILHYAAAEIAGLHTVFAAAFTHVVLPAAVAASLATSEPWALSYVAVALLTSAAAALWARLSSSAPYDWCHHVCLLEHLPLLRLMSSLSTELLFMLPLCSLEA